MIRREYVTGDRCPVCDRTHYEHGDPVRLRRNVERDDRGDPCYSGAFCSWACDPWGIDN